MVEVKVTAQLPKGEKVLFTDVHPHHPPEAEKFSARKSFLWKEGARGMGRHKNVESLTRIALTLKQAQDLDITDVVVYGSHEVKLAGDNPICYSTLFNAAGVPLGTQARIWPDNV